uniref:Uncharacterized protein n=1 Tax=Aplanochytrium stocchinoi TaxID=215587 RepID=A0A7S3V2J8_9STRA|mmetsp:Transcript_14204/g.16474  ORF Transcript_14204/g.16474 Transcript_14204/m.16474 type:complete len:344 (+) Transcript_14204:257-1288(+)
MKLLSLLAVVVLLIQLGKGIADAGQHLCFGSTALGFDCFDYLDTEMGSEVPGPGENISSIQGPIVWAEQYFANKWLCGIMQISQLRESIVMVQDTGCPYWQKAVWASLARPLGMIIYKPGSENLELDDPDGIKNLRLQFPILFMRGKDVEKVQIMDEQYDGEQNGTNGYNSNGGGQSAQNIENDSSRRRSQEGDSNSACPDDESLCNLLDCGPNHPCACGYNCDCDQCVCSSLAPCPNIMSAHMGENSELFITGWAKWLDLKNPEPITGLGFLAAVILVLVVGAVLLVRLREKRRQDFSSEDDELETESAQPSQSSVVSAEVVDDIVFIHDDDDEHGAWHSNY